MSSAKDDKPTMEAIEEGEEKVSYLVAEEDFSLEQIQMEARVM